ncbi:hypothetical protein [Peribacillus sp. FSL E2-0218]|uniref:hypothetical protein n=1 Tax=Peribacillus sp. FSL E2-0218 TaxID=2921364 RepID=UPI0030ED9555
MKKIVISFFMIVCLIFGLTITPSLADENGIDILEASTSSDYEIVDIEKAQQQNATKSEEKEIGNLFKENGLEPLEMSKIPEDAQVINFDSIEEFEKFLGDTQGVVEIEEQSNDIELLGLITGLNAVSAAVKTYKTSITKGVSSKVNLYADVTRNSKGVITKTKVWTSHTGVTLGLSWKQNSAYANLNSTKKNGTAYGKGTMSWVVFVKGIGTIYSYDVSLSLKF